MYFISQPCNGLCENPVLFIVHNFFASLNCLSSELVISATVKVEPLDDGVPKAMNLLFSMLKLDTPIILCRLFGSAMPLISEALPNMLHELLSASNRYKPGAMVLLYSPEEPH